MILVDSSVWIDYFRGVVSPATDFLDATLGVVPVATGDLILTEVLQGFTIQADFDQAKRLLERTTITAMVGHEIALQAAVNYRALRTQGITVRKTIDTLIATYCIQQDLPLLFSDRDFLPFVEHLGLRPAMPGLDIH